MSKNPTNKTLIDKTVQASQAIEGYVCVDQKITQQAKELMQKHGIIVSAKV